MSTKPFLVETPEKPASFDPYAEDYDQALGRGLAVTGESKEFFAKRRIEWLSKRLRALSFSPARVLDYGCGTGSSIPLFFEVLGAKSVLGLDVSSRSLEQARQLHGSEGVEFEHTDQHTPRANFDLAFCNGVFHHVPPEERAEVVGFIYRCLRPGGLFALWENNPWNPGTRIVMSRIPFDHDAQTLHALEGRRLLKNGGFQILSTDHTFLFPKALRAFRGLEPLVSSLPLGAQYQVLGLRPEVR